MLNYREYFINENIKNECLDYEYLSNFEVLISESVNINKHYLFLEDYIEEGVLDYLKSKGQAALGFVQYLTAHKKKPNYKNRIEPTISKVDLNSIGKAINKNVDISQLHNQAIDLYNKNENMLMNLSSLKSMKPENINKLIDVAKQYGHKNLLSHIANRSDLTDEHYDKLLNRETLKSLNDEAHGKVMTKAKESHLDDLSKPGANTRTYLSLLDNKNVKGRHLERMIGMRNNAVQSKALEITKDMFAKKGLY